VHLVASGARNAETLFFVQGWVRCGSQKKHTGTRYAELVFLHPTRFDSHVVYSGAFGV
jgi:hypothetical protein